MFNYKFTFQQENATNMQEKLPKSTNWTKQ